MSDDITTGTTPEGEGQAESAPVESASAPAPDASSAGQPSGDNGTATPSEGQAVDHVFDPTEFDRLTKELPEDVKTQVSALQKSLQGAYTKKTQAIAADRKKVEAFDAFAANPQGFIQQYAQKYGLNVQPANQEQKSDGWTPESGDPSSWQDVIEYVRGQMDRDYGEKLKPLMQEFTNIKKQTIEQQLNEIDPTWKTYEEDMVANLRSHPTLSADPAKLYRLSVPPEVLESRATQRAIAKMEAKTKSASVGGTSTTTKKPSVGLPDGKMSFEQAVQAARAKLDEDGIGPH